MKHYFLSNFAVHPVEEKKVSQILDATDLIVSFVLLISKHFLKSYMAELLLNVFYIMPVSFTISV